MNPPAVPIDPHIRRYYLYNFISSLLDAGGATLTMTYFYFHGFSLRQIAVTILVYGITALLVMKPVWLLMQRIGPRKTFLSHIIPAFLRLGIVIVLRDHPAVWLFYGWQFVHGIASTLKNIPFTAYFSHYGENKVRGAQVGLARVVVTVAGIAAPVLAGTLIDRTGIVIYSATQTVLQTAPAFLLVFKGFAVEKGWSFREIFAKVPRGLTKTLFLTTTAYPFTADFLSIFLIFSLGSFRALGEFFAVRVALEVILNIYIGRRTDLGRVRGIFIASVIFAAGFWIVLPFVHAPYALYLLQFTLGLAAIASLIPFETVYHNAAKASGHPFEFAMWREVLHNAGLIVGCGIALVILAFTPHWQLFIPLGAVSALGLLFIYPYLASGYS